jgi:hypothetical protein
LTYPESHIEEIRTALNDRKMVPDAHKAATDAALFLLAAFLHDVRRIADAMEQQTKIMARNE